MDAGGTSQRCGLSHPHILWNHERGFRSMFSLKDMPMTRKKVSMKKPTPINQLIPCPNKESKSPISSKDQNHVK
jgi:hypothetical protein